MKKGKRSIQRAGSLLRAQSILRDHHKDFLNEIQYPERGDTLKQLYFNEKEIFNEN